MNKGDIMRRIIISLKDEELKKIVNANPDEWKEKAREIILDEMVLNGILYEIINQAQQLHVIGTI